MKQTPNPNPLVEEVMQAYMNSQVGSQEFEALVERVLADSAKTAPSLLPGQTYDQGFSDGYEAALNEEK